MTRKKFDDARPTKAGTMSKNNAPANGENEPETPTKDFENSAETFENTPKISKDTAEDQNRERPLH